jgi:hypothetical protein
VVKKLGIVVYLLCSFAAFGREGIDYHDYPGYLKAWNDHMDCHNDFFRLLTSKIYF